MNSLAATRMWGLHSYLLERIGIQENPAELNDFSRVLGHVDTVLIACRSNMHYNITIDIELGGLLRRHDGGFGGWCGLNEQCTRWNWRTRQQCRDNLLGRRLLERRSRERRERTEMQPVTQPALQRYDGDGTGWCWDDKSQLKASGGFYRAKRAADRLEN